LQRLLDLLRTPRWASGSCRAHDARDSPLEVVGQELHLALFAVHLDQGAHPAQALGIIALGWLPGEHDQLVAQDVAFPFFQEPFADSIIYVPLGPGDLEHLALGQVKQLLEVYIRSVIHGNFTLLKPGTHLAGPLAVVVSCRVHDSESGQKTLQVQAQVQLGCGFAPPVARPVHTVGHQADGRGVHRVDSSLEPLGQLESFPPKPGLGAFRWLSVSQNNRSAIAPSLPRLAWERAFFGGAVARRIRSSLLP
jgi:hypothetical protein